jgi:hypothetical protein
MGVAHGFELSGTVPVSQTSETAANAKVKATDLAARQILYNVLSQYSQREELNGLIYDSSNDELMNLISSTSVSNEQISSDTYSANITMVVDNYAAKKWLDKAGVQNWIPLEESSEKFTLFIVVPNGLVDWAELKRITRSGNVEIETQTMAGNQIVVRLPLNYKSKFMAAVREAGWKYTDNGGILQVWK